MLGHEDDVKAARIAVRFCMRLAVEFQTLYPDPAPLAFAPGNGLKALKLWEGNDEHDLSHKTTPSVGDKSWEDVTDDEIDDYMRRVSHSTYHFCGTCPMGQDESHGVVDQRLMVFGFRNLRIADASVMPQIPSVHTMAPTMMIAQRCADFIKGSWAK